MSCRRILVPASLALVVVLLVPACVPLESTDEAASPNDVSVFFGGTPYDVVIVGPGAKPADRNDDAPRLFREYPGLRAALETSVPALSAGKFDARKAHMVMGLRVLGAIERGKDVDVFIDLRESWWVRSGCELVRASGPCSMVRVRLRRNGSRFVLSGVEYPRGECEQYQSSLRRMFPRWAIRFDHFDDTGLWAAMRRLAAERVRPNFPRDAFVRQTPATVPDPHGHKPPSSSFKMLAPRHIRLRLLRTRAPAADDLYDDPVSSQDGRFHLRHGSGYAPELLVEDASKRVWYELRAPGFMSIAAADSVGFGPVWRGHRLFVDFETDMDSESPTLTHYELDLDERSIVRAVPMGQMSFNPPPE